MGVRFTKEQQQVIDLRDRNILVSAAAGSGKTAVLVERIITRLTKDQPPMDVDQLLVVTYTEAAASEMKERIRNGIETALEQQPENVHLQRQATLVHHAQVTTIHSFCLSVIRDYFHTIDLDPGFRIGEEGELRLLKRDVLEEVLEEKYQEAQPQFIDFVESFAAGRDDHKLEDIILQLYEYSRSYPNPEKWLDSCVEQYHIETAEALEQMPFVEQILKEVQKILQDTKENLKFAQQVCMEEDGPEAYWKTLESDRILTEQLLRVKSFGEMQTKLANLKWERLAANRKKDVSASKIEIVKGIREECKKAVEELRKDYFYAPQEELQKGMRAAEANMQVVSELVKEFMTAYTAKKQSRNMIDFEDMEHYALQILTQEENGKLVPSSAAKEYQEKFREIMIDEYQDSNYIQEAILTSVSTVAKGNYNIFMVGDVKQSIYRFRLSRPELFMEKYHSYSTEDGKQQRIDLHKNFRSRREVLDSTNFIFKQIMSKEFGGISYDDQAALYVGASYEEQSGNETEVCFVDVSEMQEETNKREVEARAIARRIKQLAGSHMVYDKRTDSYRKAGYGDIVILTRSLKGWTDVFLRILSQEGVPAYSISKEGYFETREIQMLLNYLRVLDNPRQDIPFTAVLTSPFAEVTSEELARIKSETEAKTFYERTCIYAENGEDAELRRKLTAFLTQMNGFREQIPYTAIHNLLWSIIDETGYGNYIAAMLGGEQREANLEMLIEKAVAFESTSYKGLFHFVRYIEQLRKYDVDYGEANIVEESADVVRLMSIHKSKGLEFPIVFVAGMDKLFNMQDARSSVVIHPELGVGIDCIDIEKRIKYPSLLKRMIQKEVQKETVAEELRVLYVAMTRAREKLILMGTVSDLEERLTGCLRLKHYEKEILPYTRLTRARRYFDWIIPALYRNQAFAPVLEAYQAEGPEVNSMYLEQVPVIGSWTRVEDIVLEELEEAFSGSITKEVLKNWDTEKTYDKTMKKQIAEQFSFQYAYEAQQKIKQKVSVSELKKRAYLEEEEIEEEEVIPLLPKFLQSETEITGASRGTVYHKVMELLDFSKEYDEGDIEALLEEIVLRGILTQEMAACVNVQDILKFLQSSAGRRMRQACLEGKLHAEQPFVLGETEASGEVTLIQGIIDAYFEENGQLVVLDYKTDKVWRAAQLKEKYALQLAYYAEALQRLTGKTVKEKIIYSFTLQKEIEV